MIFFSHIRCLWSQSIGFSPDNVHKRALNRMMQVLTPNMIRISEGRALTHEGVGSADDQGGNPTDSGVASEDTLDASLLNDASNDLIAQIGG